jgi:hypothetical protein
MRKLSEIETIADDFGVFVGDWMVSPNVSVYSGEGRMLLCADTVEGWYNARVIWQSGKDDDGNAIMSSNLWIEPEHWSHGVKPNFPREDGIMTMRLLLSDMRFDGQDWDEIMSCYSGTKHSEAIKLDAEKRNGNKLDEADAEGKGGGPQEGGGAQDTEGP